MTSNKNEDDGMVLIEEFGRPHAVQAEFDGERNLSIDCTELRYLRRYLLLVGQWYPKEWNTTKRALYHIWQVENAKDILIWISIAHPTGDVIGKPN